jgi:hypothetical protein
MSLFLCWGEEGGQHTNKCIFVAILDDLDLLECNKREAIANASAMSEIFTACKDEVTSNST